MGRVMVAVDASVGVSPEQFAASWDAEPDTADLGPATLLPVREGTFLPGLTELVVVPMAVNLAAAVIYDLVRRVLARSARRREVTEVEVVEVTTAAGDRIVVARSRRESS
ncbi:hypothetical protein O7623_27530 [Solwaraspora sp. WMMD791]|uniref:hypothetical protein n=1 Tax=Solwaraspora sp. WMMD791 TaxID=3016086 RepID=UPI00249A5383|nr:hypothetical protein [Solwaraspora sp. WMMD791]WFE26974.1 hypothetical protein O7623_27530 [Solwaraspora sp. WMMD791]